MKILAIDTSTEACSAAIFVNGEILERFQIAPREHNRLILPMVDAILAESELPLGDLDALAFGRGPGAFTGIRVAVGVAQGIAYGADLPVVPVSTLAALALEAVSERSSEWSLPCIDARMGEVYWGVYAVDGDVVRLADEEQVAPPDAVQARSARSVVGIGSGWDSYEAVLRGRLGTALADILPVRFPRAAMIARLAADAFGKGLALPAEQARPVYLRDRVARKSI